MGQKIEIPYDTLQQISTSASCTNTVLDIIEKSKPNLTVKEMQTVLREMQRGDVSTVLDKLSGSRLYNDYTFVKYFVDRRVFSCLVWRKKVVCDRGFKLRPLSSR